MGNAHKKTDRRLHFGVVLHSLDNTRKFNLLHGISDYAQAHDINLTAYFGSYMSDNYDVPTRYEPCFEAINENKAMDGVVFFSGFLAQSVGSDNIKDYARSISKKMPAISIGLDIDDVYSVIIDNAHGMYLAIEHLIKYHGKKRIVFIKGPAGHPEAEQRLAGYKKALEDNGIAYNCNLVVQGNFSPSGGREAIAELMDRNKIQDFDAVAACDDDAAFGAMTSLKQRGIRVPEDVAVTGFNDVEEAARHEPPLSSVHQDFSQLGIIALQMLHSIILGEKTDRVNLVMPEFVLRHSCGCEYDAGKDTSMGQESDIMEDYLFRRRVMDHMVLQFDVDSLADSLNRTLQQFSTSSVLIGLYKNSIEYGKETDADRSIVRLTGYSTGRRIDITENDENPFLLADYTSIPGFDFTSHRQTLFFLPLFYVDEENGVLLISYDSIIPLESYEVLRRNVSTAVKGASLLDKIQLLSITDELTGLLNRRGFFQRAYARILYLQRQKGAIPVILAMDMDKLKFINDTYGHAEGDIAISAFARLLRDALREEDIISRTGGDEFIVFSLIKSEDNIDKLVRRIRDKIDEYNARELHPYKISGSIGAVTLEEPTYAALDRAMLNADNIMYDEKDAKKKG